MIVYRYRYRKHRNYRDEAIDYQNWLRSRSHLNENRDTTPSLKEVKIVQKERGSIDLGCRVCYCDLKEAEKRSWSK